MNIPMSKLNDRRHEPINDLTIQKVRWLIYCILANCVLPVNSGAQNSISISTDTVMTEACFGSPILFDTIYMQNVTDHDVNLIWERTRLSLPHVVNTFLIIDPAQYPHTANHHHVVIHSMDSSRIMFHVWTDTLNPGDSVVWQLHLYDELHPLDFDTVVTAIAVCPLASGIAEQERDEKNIRIYPNPVRDIAVMKLGIEFIGGVVQIFDLSGRLLRTLSLNNNEVLLDRDGLQAGLYIARIDSDLQHAWPVKFVILDD